MWSDAETKLLESLAVVVQSVGAPRFMESALVLPAVEFFPDRLGRTAEGLQRVLRTLLHHASIKDVGVVVSERVHELNESKEHPAWSPHAGGGLWLSSVASEVARFGADVSQLEDVLGAASHEVAHALVFHHDGALGETPSYRQAPKFVPHIQSDEPRVQAMEIALGFGALAVNHSVHSATRDGPVTFKPNSTPARATYLKAHETCFLFAAQLAARDLEKPERERVFELMNDDAADIVGEAMKRLAKDRDRLLDALRLTPLNGDLA